MSVHYQLYPRRADFPPSPADEAGTWYLSSAGQWWKVEFFVNSVEKDLDEDDPLLTLSRRAW